MNRFTIHLRYLSYTLLAIMLIGSIHLGYAGRPNKNRKTSTKTNRLKNKQSRYHLKGKNKTGRHISHKFNTRSIPNAKEGVKRTNTARRGNTGRIKTRSLKERFDLAQFKQNPNGKRLIPMKSKIKDPRWKRGGWKKYFVEGTNIHFLRRLKGGRHEYDDIKLKSKQNHYITNKKGQRTKINLSNQFYAKVGPVGKGPFAQFYHASQGRNLYYIGRYSRKK